VRNYFALVTVDNLVSKNTVRITNKPVIDSHAAVQPTFAYCAAQPVKPQKQTPR